MDETDGKQHSNLSSTGKAMNTTEQEAEQEETTEMRQT